MENWLDDAQPKEAGGASATVGSVFDGHGTGTRTRRTRVRGFWEAVDEPESARTEVTAALPTGTALLPHLTDAGTAGADHDPHELTVQLASTAPVSPEGGPESQDGAGKPVFVDESGRRSRRLRWLGTAVGTACSVYALVIVATLVSGNAGAPWLPLPGQVEDTPVEQVETSAEPSVTASPSGPAGAAPSAGAPDASAPTAAGATAGAVDAPAASSGPGRSEASAPPEPSTGTTTRKPAATATASSPAAPESSAPAPAASLPDNGGVPSPTADTGTDTDGGEGTGDTGLLSSLF